MSTILRGTHMADNASAFLVDGIKTIAIHNDLARIQFMQLGNDSKPQDEVLLLLPLRQVAQISEALRNIRR